MLIKADTTEIMAELIKTPPNSMAKDIMRRIPGLTVISGGKLMYNAKPVNKILVDDKAFFGEDGAVPKHADMGLMSPQKDITGFEMAGKDTVLYPAIVEIKGNVILLRADRVKHVEAARYSFKEEELGYVYNTAGLPLLPFRTDKWECIN